jgi:hypothetical protein
MSKAAFAGLAATILLIGPSQIARADQKSDDIQTLLRLTHRDMDTLMRTNSRMLNGVMQRFEARSPNLTNAQDAKIAAAAHDITSRYIAAEESQISSYYYEHMSEDEIRGTIAFLQSPDGRAYLGASRGLREMMDSNARQKLPGMVQELIRAFKAVLTPRDSPTLPESSKSL